MTEKKERKIKAGPAVVLICDGREVPLNPFVKRFIEKTLLGMVGALDGIPDNPKTIEIKIRRR